MNDKIELSKEDIKVLIENILYSKVKILVEGHYNQEGVIDEKQKKSNKLIFRDKEEVIKLVAGAIIDFAEENNLEVSEVKEYLLRIIKNSIDLDNIHKQEYKEINNIVLNFPEKDEEK